MTMKTIGRFSLLVELAGKKGNTLIHDVVLSKDDKVIDIATCTSGSMLKRYTDLLSDLGQRLNILYDALDMANHNLLCYSNSYLMDTWKEGYEEQWTKNNDKQICLTKWIAELEKKGV